MIATAEDYRWFSPRFPDLADAYCVTLVRDLAPAELLRRIGAGDQVRCTGVSKLVEAAYALGKAHDGDQQFIAATAVGPWTLAVEPNGYLGVTEEFIVPLSRGTRLVSHFRNINAVDRFYWLDDGDIRLDFEPLFPTERYGTDPDGLVDVMRQVGFDLRSDEEDSRFELVDEAAFALAAYLTEVRLTPELLDSAIFLCGSAPLPNR